MKCRTNNVSMDFLAENVTNKEEFEKAVLRNNASLMKKKNIKWKNLHKHITLIRPTH